MSGLWNLIYNRRTQVTVPATVSRPLQSCASAKMYDRGMNICRMERKAVAHQQPGVGKMPAAGGNSPRTGHYRAGRCATQLPAAWKASAAAVAAAAGAEPTVPAGTAAEAPALISAAELHLHSCAPHTILSQSVVQRHMHADQQSHCWIAPWFTTCISNLPI